MYKISLKFFNPNSIYTETKIRKETKFFFSFYPRGVISSFNHMKIINIKKIKIIKIINIINLIKEGQTNKNINNFLIIKEEGKIYFLINNLNIQIKIKIKLKTKFKKKLIIGINLKKFMKIIKNLENNIIKIKLIKNKIIIKQKKIKYTIKNIKVNNYDIINFKKKNNLNIKIDQKNIYEIINSIYFMINKNNKLSKTLINIKNDNIRVISTDNYRIIYNKVIIKNQKNIKKKLIINNNFLLIIYKIIKNIKNKIINIEINKFQIKFKINKLEIISSVITKKFPILKTNKKKYENSFTINKLLLLPSIKRSLIITEKNYNFSKWIIKKNILKIITKSNSEKSCEILNINYDKENMVIYINNDHILELINNIKTKDLNFNFSKKNKNIIILTPGYKNLKYITTQVKI